MWRELSVKPEMTRKMSVIVSRFFFLPILHLLLSPQKNVSTSEWLWMEVQTHLKLHSSSHGRHLFPTNSYRANWVRTVCLCRRKQPTQLLELKEYLKYQRFMTVIVKNRNLGTGEIHDWGCWTLRGRQL